MSTPDRFSLNTLSQPASFSSWTARSWPVLLTLAYPTVVMSVPFPLRGSENGYMRHEMERVKSWYRNVNFLIPPRPYYQTPG